jgi:hypothetical protein
MNIHPENTKANYITELYSPLKFDYPYEVALTEIIHPSFQKFSRSLGSIHLTSINAYGSHPLFIDNISSDIIENSNINYIVERINEILDNIKKFFSEAESVGPKLFIKDTEDKTQFLEFNNFSANYSVFFYGEIANILGFKQSTENIKNILKPGEKSTIFQKTNFEKLRFDLDTMFVYSDIIKYQYVGDSSKQLLRAVFVSNNEYSQCKTYDSPHYVPVTKNYIDSIQITIKDSFNDLFKFISGSELVIVKLHFRPQKYGF